MWGFLLFSLLTTERRQSLDLKEKKNPNWIFFFIFITTTDMNQLCTASLTYSYVDMGLKKTWVYTFEFTYKKSI